MKIAATTLENTLMMLQDMIDAREELLLDDLFMIMDIVDGCPAQYKCYTALWSLSVIAQRYITDVLSVNVTGSADATLREVATRPKPMMHLISGSHYRKTREWICRGYPLTRWKMAD